MCRLLNLFYNAVDPVCVQSSFTVPDTSYGIIHVGVISPLTASPGTRAALEVCILYTMQGIVCGMRY